jgi:hypothetical protein
VLEYEKLQESPFISQIGPTLERFVEDNISETVLNFLCRGHVVDCPLNLLFRIILKFDPSFVFEKVLVA